MRRPQKFGTMFLKVWTLLSIVQTLRKIAPTFCGGLRKPELYFSWLKALAVFFLKYIFSNYKKYKSDQ